MNRARIAGASVAVRARFEFCRILTVAMSALPRSAQDRFICEHRRQCFSVQVIDMSLALGIDDDHQHFVSVRIDDLRYRGKRKRGTNFKPSHDDFSSLTDRSAFMPRLVR
ncbi:hypothetical protein WI84_26360 [Burkholderia ubonensis]|nr:hypothetical protein WI84_26360 [Burkholderia ubonensis]KWI34184.1 hypothetical protein WM04_09810 [Burkholderia ubonensis]OJB15937.1 hypothetical protein BGV53_18955 [Burkholderia ubonensis]